MRHGRPRFDVLGQLGSLRRYARALTRDDGEAEELVHDALVRAYEKRSSFKPDRNLRNWLLAILHNVFIDRVRSRRSELERNARAVEMADTVVEPDQDHAVRLAQVRNNFMALPEEQRAALHLVAVEGLAYADAAATLGIPVGTLMSRLGRARAALRAMEENPSRRASSDGRLRVVGGENDAH
ncbi:sigma-70 family RNA polymerase sigma factor [Rhodoligotrophos defluvii]|uniref:sigma-70 family RNA polymerase sigma factor n=1 Tax=Rhodoligotrophos defluvii TaxID=2561934 RepID=UPI0010CA0BC9|nr:sigma-70 family RNA polymerase sigma factor [Rhodoligotrophos defluvii]